VKVFDLAERRRKLSTLVEILYFATRQIFVVLGRVFRNFESSAPLTKKESEKFTARGRLTEVLVVPS
jgi:metallophosphoesterase superfamily enzyme